MPFFDEVTDDKLFPTLIPRPEFVGVLDFFLETSVRPLTLGIELGFKVVLALDAGGGGCRREIPAVGPVESDARSFGFQVDVLRIVCCIFLPRKSIYSIAILLQGF